MSIATQNGRKNYSHFSVGDDARVHAGDQYNVNQTVYQTVLSESEVLKAWKPAFRFVQVFDFATSVERAIEKVVRKFDSKSGRETLGDLTINIKELIKAYEWLEVPPFEDTLADDIQVDLGDLPRRSAECHTDAKHLLYLLQELRASEQGKIDTGAKFASEIARLNKRLDGLLRSEEFARSQIHVDLANIWVHAARQTVQSGQGQTELHNQFAALQISIGGLAKELVLHFWSERASKSKYGHKSTDREQCIALLRPLAAWPMRECNEKARVVRGQLSFEQMKERQALADAWPSTYRWALRDDLCGLRTWLIEGEGIYWIAGKAGSGKSTLMKFLSTETETKTLLNQWCGDQDLVILSFYFWFAGSALQKSTLGLLRSMLHQVLSERPALVRIAFPDTSDFQAATDSKWTKKQLFAAYERIANHKGESRTGKFCIFVDGLDEYHGNHGELVALLKSLARGNNIKLCVASRPLNAFRIAYEDKPHLRLEELSESDIRCFVSDRIYMFGTEANIIDYLDLRDAMITRSQAISQYERNDDYDALVDIIVQKAEGVFLWVYLVVKSVLSGLAEGDSFQMMQFRVEEFPQDLDKFFSSILQRVDPVYRNQTNQHLKLALLYMEDEEAREVSSWLDFWLISANPTGLKPQAAYELTLKDSMPRSMRNDLQKSLSSSCKDLLFLPSKLGLETKVTWLHRSVYDYLRDQGTTVVIDKNVPESFKNGEALQDMWLLRCKVLHWYGKSAKLEIERLFSTAFSRTHSLWSKAYATIYDIALLTISRRIDGSDDRPNGFRHETGITAMSKLVAFGQTSYVSRVVDELHNTAIFKRLFKSGVIEIREIILACIGESPSRPFRICDANLHLVHSVLRIPNARDCVLLDPALSSCRSTLSRVFWRKWAMETSSFNQAEFSRAWKVAKLLLGQTTDLDCQICTASDPTPGHTHTFAAVRMVLTDTVPEEWLKEVNICQEERISGERTPEVLTGEEPIPEKRIPEKRGIRSRISALVKRNKYPAPSIATAG